MDYLILFVSLGLLMGGTGIFFHRLVISNKSIPLTSYFILNFIGIGLGPTVYFVTEMMSLEHSQITRLLLSYGMPIGMVIALLCIVVGSFFALSKNVSVARQILKVPIIYATIWTISFIMILFFNSVMN